MAKIQTYPSIAILLILLNCLVRHVHSQGCSSRPTLKLYSGYPSRGQGSLKGTVRELQTLLKGKGYSLIADGYFGQKTVNMVRDYQSRNGLSVDGIVGTETWSSLCGTGDTNPGRSTCDVRNPHGASKRFDGWTPRATFVLDAVKSCFPGKFRFGGSTRPFQPQSDHATGNAIDIFSGNFGVRATGQDKIDGDALAAWAVSNADALQVKYVIWYRRIWTAWKASQGWRDCATPGESCYGGDDIVAAHYDHVHISVNTP